MNKLLRFTCVLALALPAAATNISFQGTFATDDQIQLFNFTVNSTSTVTLVSLAYGGGTNSASSTIPAGGFDSFFRATYNRASKPVNVWGPPQTARILHHRFQGFLESL